MGKQKLTFVSLILMIFTSTYAFSNIIRAYYLMGYASIIFYIGAAICYFLPYAFMIIEFGSAYQKSKGGIYTWMSDSVSPKFAFIGVLIWYAGFITFMINVSSIIWIPFSTAIFGVDKTQTWSLFGLNDVQTMGLLAAVLIVFVTFIATRGVQRFKTITSIGGIAMFSITGVIIIGGAIVLLLNGTPLQPIDFGSFFHSPNPSYVSIFSVLSFAVYAIFAFGGFEVMGGLVDQTDEPQKTFQKGMVVASLMITICYAVGILMMGMFTNWNEVFNQNNSTQITLGNVVFIAMKNFGYQLGLAFHLSESISVQIGLWVSRYLGIAMVFTTIGLFVTIIFSPLKQLIEGAPKEIWPKYMRKEKNDLPVNAMKVQALLVVGFVLLVSFGGKTAQNFFDVLVSMTNVSMSVPYLFIVYAYFKFRKNNQVNRPITFFKSYRSAKYASILVLTTVTLAIFFTVISPAIEGNLMNTFWMIIGPIFFGIVGFLMYNRYERKYLK